MTKSRIATLFALCALPLALTGCGRTAQSPLAPAVPAENEGTGIARIERDNDPATWWNGAFGLSRVMIVHASPDAPNVDVKVGRLPVARNLGFPDNTPYRWVFSGTRSVKVNVAGTSTTVIRADVPFERRRFYSVFAIDRVANIAPLLTTDDLTPPAPGKAHVRFIHLSPDAPAVDVALANGGAVVFGDRSFKSVTPFTPLPAGSYDLEVRVAGTPNVALPLPGIKLEAGKIYTVFAKGLLSGTGAQALGAQIIVNSDVRRWQTPMPAEESAADAR